MNNIVLQYPLSSSAPSLNSFGVKSSFFSRSDRWNVSLIKMTTYKLPKTEMPLNMKKVTFGPRLVGSIIIGHIMDRTSTVPQSVRRQMPIAVSMTVSEA